MRTCGRCKNYLCEEYFERSNCWCIDCCGFMHAKRTGTSYITINQRKKIEANAPMLKKLEDLNKVRLWILNRVVSTSTIVQSLVKLGMDRQEAYQQKELIHLIRMERKTKQLLIDKPILDKIQNDILQTKSLLQ